jgi:hypothetical protein
MVRTVYRGHEFIVAMGFATARRQEIEVTIGACDEPVEASTDKDGRYHDESSSYGYSTSRSNRVVHQAKRGS